VDAKRALDDGLVGFGGTLRALVEPRRLLPIAFVCVPLVIAQATFSRDTLAVPLGIALCLTFVLVAPTSYRALFLAGVGPTAARVLAYLALALICVGGLGFLLPKLLGMGETFLTSRTSVVVSLALFIVGGWGLARDVDLEARLERERARAHAMEREAERAQLLSIRANLDPHFLFNTLNAIAEWCREDGAVAERAILKLSAMLRAVLDGVRTPTWPLERELELVRALFELHSVRSPSSFRLRWQIDERALGVPVLPLLLLPLAENAMKHGPNAGHSGEVSFVVALGANVLDIALENPGPNAGPRPGSTGLPTVERRLALAYGDAARLAIRSRDGARTEVVLTVPVSGPRGEINV
jgi:two-component system sensor histidine kinase AlgZ